MEIKTIRKPKIIISPSGKMMVCENGVFVDVYPALRWGMRKFPDIPTRIPVEIANDMLEEELKEKKNK